MRKNLVHQPGVPETRNDFIDMVRNKKEVILLKNSLIHKLEDDIKSSISDKESGKLLKKGGVSAGILGILLSSHPVGWFVGGATAFGIGVYKKFSDSLRKYNIYTGKDKEGNDIYSLVRKTRVDFEYDTINYPDWVAAIEKKIK